MLAGENFAKFGELNAILQYFTQLIINQWRIQDLQKEGSTPTQMHNRALLDSCAQQFNYTTYPIAN